MDTFDKSTSRYERKVARQRQLDMMEAAASGQPPQVSRTTWAHSPPEGAVESARRFLWDDDEDEYQTPSRHFPGQVDSSANQNINLNFEEQNEGMGNRQSGGSIGSRLLNRLPSFSAQTGTETSERRPVNIAPHGHLHSDASPSADAEEYIEEVRFQGRRNQGGSFISPIGDCCLAIFHTVVGIIAILFELIFSCLEGYSRKKKLVLFGGLAGVLVLIFSIVAITKRGGGSGSDIFNGGTSAEIQDMARYNSIRKIILDSTFTSIDHLDTEGTAQNLALRWLTDDDPAKVSVDIDALLQRYALGTFYFSTYVQSQYQDEQGADDSAHVANWYSMEYWMTDKGICLWHGVFCPPRLHEGIQETQYNENSDVTHLNLTANNIRGTVPSELAALENLVSLDLGKNDLKGTIPDALTKFRFLEELYLEENDMEGTIPTEVGKLTLLEDLYIGTNKFSGTIPSELNKLTLLRGLGLDDCLLTGTIPHIWDLKELLTFYLDSNRLTGTLSDDIQHLTEVIDFRVNRNSLSGTMPIEFHWLQKLELLYMDDNAFTGTVPEVFDRTPRLEELHLYKNKFTGVFPDSIEALRDLKVLYLDNNAFSATIPKDWGNLDHVRVIYLFNNKLHGDLPSELGKMEDLTDLQVQNNRLTGSIPSELANCYKLEKLELNDNYFEGSIPTEFGNLKKLQMLKLYRNSFAGTMPQQVCALTTDFNLDFLSADCDTKAGGDIECDCCHLCYP